MEKIYLVIATHHNLDDYERIIATFKNAINAQAYAKEKQEEISVNLVEYYVKQEFLRDTY